jgi:hypothetical protein
MITQDEVIQLEKRYFAAKRKALILYGAKFDSTYEKIKDIARCREIVGNTDTVYKLHLIWSSATFAQVGINVVIDDTLVDGAIGFSFELI